MLMVLGRINSTGAGFGGGVVDPSPSFGIVSASLARAFCLHGLLRHPRKVVEGLESLSAPLPCTVGDNRRDVVRNLHLPRALSRDRAPDLAPCVPACRSGVRAVLR